MDTNLIKSSRYMFSFKNIKTPSLLMILIPQIEMGPAQKAAWLLRGATANLSQARPIVLWWA
jgi:hypothetical protein